MVSTTTLIGIIGCSKVGVSLGAALSKQGFSKIYICKATKEPFNKKLAKFNFCYKNSQFDLDSLNFVGSMSKLIKLCNVIFIAVKDDKISHMVNKIEQSGIDINNKYFLHFSGSLTSDVFYPLKRKNKVYIGSIHPVQSFPSIEKGIEKIFDIYWVFEGDKEIIKVVKPFIDILRGRMVNIDKKTKILHHIICVFCGNFITGLLYLAEKLALEGGNNIEIYLPLIESVINNFKSAKNAKEILTGPLVRGDVTTIKSHIEYLQKYPLFLEYYMQFSKILLSMAQDKVDKSKHKQLQKLLDIPSRNYS